MGGAGYDQDCFFKAHSGYPAAWGHRAGQEVSSSESKEMIRRSWLYSRPVAAVEMGTVSRDVGYTVEEEWIGPTHCARSGGKMEK